MKALIFTTLAVLFCLGSNRALSQVKAPPHQEAGDCSVNLTGSGNNVSLVCTNVDPKVADQVRAILNGIKRNEKATKDVSDKLDLILRQISKPPPRRIPAERRAEIVATLARKPAKVSIMAISGNSEAYQFAQDWYDVFKEAGWTIHANAIMTFIDAGKPKSGIFIHLHGETLPGQTSVNFPKDSPAGVLVDILLSALNVGRQMQVQLDPNRPVDELHFQVRERPEN
jgi:hypothetical protein